MIIQKFPIPTLEEISCKVKDKAVFSVLDLKDGFWHASLDEESSLLCSFSTPFGIYKFKKLPFGISSAPELFQYLTKSLGTLLESSILMMSWWPAQMKSIMMG